MDWLKAAGLYLCCVPKCPIQ